MSKCLSFAFRKKADKFLMKSFVILKQRNFQQSKFNKKGRENSETNFFLKEFFEMHHNGLKTFK